MKNIPVITVQEKTLALAYEKALISLYENGMKIKTQYDKQEDEESIDATANITVLEPESEPMIHKAFPGGIEDLREYVYELHGYKNHWVKNMNEQEDTRWEYTYHQRLSDWGAWYENENGERVKINHRHEHDDGINQIDKVIDKLVKQPFTRQAQMITWMPFIDNDVYDPPCLQSIWYRLLLEDDIYYLNSNIRFRSNDAWGAHFMNAFGFIQFNKTIANKLSEKLNKKVLLGRMNWQADSFHIYGKDIKDFKERLYDRKKEPFVDRTYNFKDDFIQDIYKESEQQILNKIRKYDLDRFGNTTDLDKNIKEYR